MDHHSTDSGAPVDDGAQNRTDTRDSLFLSAQLRLGDVPETTVRVRNLSAGGLMVELPMEASVGQSVEVEVRGVGWVPGRIAWTTDGRAGIAFDKPIDPRAARKPVGQGTRTPHYAKPIITRR
jgi:hypothetical protein